MARSENPKVLLDALEMLESAAASLRCKDLVGALGRLGFEVREGKSPGHKVFTHPCIPEFTASSFNCGHGANPEVKRNYPRSVLKLLRQYEADLYNLFARA
jgi:hypothetical protein